MFVALRNFSDGLSDNCKDYSKGDEWSGSKKAEKAFLDAGLIADKSSPEARVLLSPEFAKLPRASQQDRRKSDLKARAKIAELKGGKAKADPEPSDEAPSESKSKPKSKGKAKA